MWYRFSSRGLIRYEEVANEIAKILYPAFKGLYPKYKDQIKELKKEYQLLEAKQSSYSPEHLSKLISEYSAKVKPVQNSLENDMTQAFNSARFILSKTDLDYDFDFYIILSFNSDWKGGYYNKKFYLSYLDIESEEDLAETIEHELVHNKQFKNYGQGFSQKKLQRIKNTNYFDLKYEIAALATNVLRQLPNLSDYINDRFQVFKATNPWANYENFVVEEIQSLLNNSQNFQKFLEQSEWFVVLMYGDEDRSPIQKQYNKNKLIKILHEAISRQAKEMI